LTWIPPEFLDSGGAEAVVIGASEYAHNKLGVHLPEKKKTEKTADTFHPNSTLKGTNIRPSRSSKVI
jgi:hypothetical protein